jgi:guanyl-specific ribonuclease Sa
MKPSFLISVAAGLLLAGCGNNSSSPNSQGTNTSQTTNTTDSAHPAAPSGGYLGALMQADKYAVKTIDVSYLNEAVQLFNTQEGRLPKDLNELVPNYVGKLPATPYGTKLDYDPNTGQVKVVKQ